MKMRFLLKKGVAFLLLLTCITFLHQPLAANAASTTEKKATVKFTKTKISGFTKISTVTSIRKYLVVLGQKARSNVFAYSEDGMNFKYISLDSAINKEYNNEKVESVELGAYPDYVEKTGSVLILGSATMSGGDIEHFIIVISNSMKAVKVITLDAAVKKMDSEAKDIFINDYADYYYKKGYIVISGTYNDNKNSEIPFYILSKNGAAFTAYKTPSVNSRYVDFVGSYLVSYGATLDKESKGVGAFYYSKDCIKWTKAVTPKDASSASWVRSYYKGEVFGASLKNDSSDKYKLFYTTNMKAYKSISKDYIIKDKYRSMNFEEYGDKYIAEEHGLGDNTEIVLSERSKKAGSKWKVLLKYKQKNSGVFYYRTLYSMDGGVIIIQDGNTKKLYRLKNGKLYTTTVDLEKLDICYYASTEAYGGYDSKYLFGTKSSFAKNYLFKAPIKFNRVEECSTNKFRERMYVYSDSSMYFVSKAALKKAMK